MKKIRSRILKRKSLDISLETKLEKNTKNQLDLINLAGSLQNSVRLTDDELQKAITQSYIQAGVKGLTGLKSDF